MKRTLAILLTLCMTALSCAALAQTSAIRQEGQFALQFADFSSTETHAMQLQKGDVLDILASCEKGNLSISVKYENGAVLYFGSDAVPSIAAVTVPRDGIYRINVTGDKATGSAIVSRNLVTRAKEQESAALYARQLGSLGYQIAYEQGLFAFEALQGADCLYSLPAAGGLERAELLITRVPGLLDDTALSLLTTDGAAELPATVIDWHAARSIRVAEGADDRATVNVHTLIELNNGELLICQARCALADETILGEKLAKMVASLQFLY